MSGNTVVGRGTHLWVGSFDAVYAYPKNAHGPAPAPSRSIAIPGSYSADTTVAPDGTVYEVPWDEGVLVFSPCACGAAKPEQHLTVVGPNGTTLVGDAIDAAAFTSNQEGPLAVDTVTVASYAYAAGDYATPFRTLYATFPPVQNTNQGNTLAGIATDSHDRIYVYHLNWVQVYKAGASGNAAPIRTIPVNVATPIGFTVDASKNVYILASNAARTTFSVLIWQPGNQTSTPDRTIGPFPAATRSSVVGAPAGIAVDASGRVFVGTNSQLGDNVYTFAAGASGQAAPSQVLTNLPPITSLAIGP